MKPKRQMDDTPLEPPTKRRTSARLAHNRIVPPSPFKAAPRQRKQRRQRICCVCGEEKSTSDFPNATHVSAHSHDHAVCLDCFSMHLEVEVDSKIWDQVSCPQCPNILQQHEIEHLTTPECFEKYERFARRAVLSSNPDYRYCFSTSCDSGQIHQGKEPIFSCQDCGHKHCTICEVDWHNDETCEQYQSRDRIQKEHDAESEAKIQATSKPCPNCKARIEKSEGCDHMTCFQCHHQFCWTCLVDFIPIARHGLHNHAADCRNHRLEGHHQVGNVDNIMMNVINARNAMERTGVRFERFQELFERIFGVELQE